MQWVRGIITGFVVTAWSAHLYWIGKYDIAPGTDKYLVQAKRSEAMAPFLTRNDFCHLHVDSTWNAILQVSGWLYEAELFFGVEFASKQAPWFLFFKLLLDVFHGPRHLILIHVIDGHAEPSCCK